MMLSFDKCVCFCLELEVENEVVTGFLFKVSEHSGSLFPPINEDFFYHV
jgi:hypothetical protein